MKTKNNAESKSQKTTVSWLWGVNVPMFLGLWVAWGLYLWLWHAYGEAPSAANPKWHNFLNVNSSDAYVLCMVFIYLSMPIGLVASVGQCYILLVKVLRNSVSTTVHILLIIMHLLFWYSAFGTEVFFWHLS